MTEAQRGHLAMLSFSLLVAGSYSLGGLVANDIAPIALNFVRFVIAAIFVALIGRVLGLTKRSDFVAPWRYAFLGGLFSIYFVFMFEALKTAPPVNTAVVFTLLPLLSAGFGWVLLRQGVPMTTAVALGIGALGAVWVIFRGELAALLAFEVGRGEAIFFAGTIAHAAYIPLSRMLNRGASPFGFTLGVLIGGAVALGVVGAGPVLQTDWGALPAIVWITILYVAIPATSLTFTCLYFASLRLPAAKVSAYTYLTPSWVLMWERMLGNPMPPLAIMGGVVLTIIALTILLLAPDS